MSQKRKAANDEGVHPSKKRKMDNKVDQTPKPPKLEVIANNIESNHKTLHALKVKRKKNRNSPSIKTLQKSDKTGQTKDGLSLKTTVKATVTVEETSSSSKNKLSIHRPQKSEEVSCNWKQLLKSGKVVHNNKKTSQKSDRFEKREELEKSNDSNKCNEIWFDGVDEILLETGRMQEPTSSGKPEADGLVKPNAFEGLTRVVAIDCEMVGVGLEGKDSILARVSIVNHFGQCLYDKYVKPGETVTDYRTFVSGIRPSDLKHAEDFKTVQKEVSDILTGRILVGHAIHNDLKVLFLDHPHKKIRDTSRYKPFRALVGGGLPSLKKLSEKLLAVKIQDGEHSSQAAMPESYKDIERKRKGVEMLRQMQKSLKANAKLIGVQDAQAAMRLYTMHRKKWESSLKKKR